MNVFTGTSQAYTDDVIMTSLYESSLNLPVNLIAKTSPIKHQIITYVCVNVVYQCDTHIGRPHSHI